MSDKAEKTVLERAVETSAKNPAFFLRFFLKHWFPTPLPPFHLGILALITKKVEFLNDYPEAHEFLLNEFKYSSDPNLPEGHPDKVELPVFQLGSDGKIIMVCDDHNNVIVPRGFSKTTLTNGVNLYQVLTDGTAFIVYISKAADHAEMQLGNIKIELETNDLLRKAYGNVVPTRADVEKWQADQLQLTNGAILVARGRGGQVRGLNYRARRPNKIVLDDVEDDGSVESPTERVKTEKWFYSAVEKAGADFDATEAELAQAPLQIINLGTLLGSQCLMMALTKDPKFNTVRFGAKLHYEDQEDTQMLWPLKMGYAKYQKERARHATVGKLSEFTRELDSSIRVSDDSLFPQTFIYEMAYRAEFAQVAIALDPAISEQPGRDPAAIVVVGRRARDGVLFALEEWGGLGKTPREKIDAFMALHKKWQCTNAGIEAQGYQAALMPILLEEMAEARYFFHCVPIIQGSKVKKEDRILGLLSPRYMAGRIRHLRIFPGIEGNIKDWPNGKKDHADAFAMALTLMGETGAMVIPQAEREQGEYAPLQSNLPPAVRTVSNHIVRGSPQARRMAERYPTG